MRTNHQEPRDHDALTDLGYETRDVSISGVRTVTIAWTALIVGASVLVGLWYWLLGPGSHTPPGLDANRVIPQKVNANNPPLQSSITAKTDIMTLRRKEDERLEATGNVDPSKGIVHIPIERAMDIVASGKFISTGQNVPARVPGTNSKSQTNPTGPAGLTGGAPR